MNPVIAYISRSALRHNLQRTKELAPNTKVLAMIKANAYGHDAIEIARTLGDADALGVSRISEALAIVDAGVKHTLVLMEGCFDLDELQAASNYGFHLVIQNEQQLLDFERATITNPVHVWLKLNTGMNRLGLPSGQASLYAKRIKQSDNCSSLKVMTHFASADDSNTEFTEQQLSQFVNNCGSIDGEKSCANSAAIIAHPDSHFDWVRPGIMLYGNSPIADNTSVSHGLKPVMSLTSAVIAINSVKKGDTVGYGQCWTATEDTRIAVIAMGYGDGYPRSAQNGTPVMINGVVYPLAGRVSMDMLTVDVGLTDSIKIGDPVELWGENLPAEKVAAAANTISYEMFCNLANRVKKVFID